MKSWTDQPDAVELLSVLFRLSHKGAIVEVRKGETTWYVTAGNRFGSQTLKVPSAEAALRLLNRIVHRKDDQMFSLDDLKREFCGKRDDLDIVEIRYDDGDYDTLALCPRCRDERRRNGSLIGYRASH
jgi:hypothetical protein